ncbi:transcription termination factor Rho [Streptomyces sp. DvalAA-14]|uniref:transcription termination factor Rho n=1 Tax=unclassified Streptomyces TaxID=2593676 RepID=UPI00081B2419|nr:MULTISPECIES: transcription termination factor Rho [unclassified Streptomyces]MYS21396.1 transcription termination factor Rho [Streptomyces sp. SID4948]SCD91550.1 transcription termination factor Rho [Streptomyces sp. DvalAA-14]
MTEILERPQVQRESAPMRVVGVLDVSGGGAGRLRHSGWLATPDDVQVPAAQIRSAGLRKGDLVEGVAGRPGTLAEVRLVNGLPPGGRRRHFAELTPLHPRQPLRLESGLLKGSGAAAGRIMDLMTPVGKGQRGLIVAPPKTGKTMLLQSVAAAIAANHPECHLMVLLLDERPEEVTDMRRSVRGEVIASTFDQPAKQHIAVAELVVERAKRLVELGQDVVILLDSLTRLCRAHNTAASGSGRTLSGGVDAAALLGPKRLFGAARLAEEGGSLTILATALVDTGSRADNFYYEELKGTGNMELHLDRALAEQRVFPAVDVLTSGTRREELLLPAAELSVVRGLRRVLHGRDAQSGLEVLLERIRQTPDNAAFLRQIQGTLPA